MPDVARLLVLLGAVLVAGGLLLWAGPHVSWLGRLPGDIRIERPGFRFYFPLTTCLLAGLALSLILRVLRR